MTLDSTSISNIMIRNVITADVTQNIFDISKIMAEQNIGSVIIVKEKNGKEPIGIVTERDIIKVLGFLEPYQLTTSIKDHMSQPLITLDSKASINDTIKLMHVKNIRRIIVTEEEKMVGIVTNKDIFKILIENKEMLSSAIESQSTADHHSKIKEEIMGFWLDNR